jgi:NAD dependent epimerase/dehydratase
MAEVADSGGPKFDWNHKTVLVTGAGGFIGSHLTERLVTLGATTRALVQYNSTGTWGWLDASPDKEHIEVFLGDIQDRDSLREAVNGADIVFHLAALIAIPYSYNAPMSYVRTNVEGTLNVLQASLDAGVQLAVHTSTSEVYGSARQVPINEDHPLQGQSPYSASKIGADQMAQAFHRSFGLPVTTIRPFNTYGPRQSARAVIPTIITQALTLSEVRLGTLTPTRDFNYVADTVEGFIKIAECPEAVGKVLNIGSGQEISIGNLYTTILELLGMDVPVLSSQERLRPENSEVDRLCADNSKAQKLLGWKPQYTLKDGLTHTIEWLENNIEQYRVGTYTV